MNVRWLACFALCAGSHVAPAQSPSESGGASTEVVTVESSQLGKLSVWDDGLCEMSYYRATDLIYGTRRAYTRVHLVNRQWMDPATGVKAKKGTAGAVAVFKLNMSEGIPTENYHYRYLTTAFLRRENLQPFKLVVSSQEWCGSTFKQIRWLKEAASLKTFSYFGGEGDSERQFDPGAFPYEGLFLLAREVVAEGEGRALQVLAPMRSSHQVEPVVQSAKLTIQEPATVTVAAGEFHAQRVDLVWDGALTSFVVESEAPFRLLRFRAGPIRCELLHLERRAYWDRSWPSSYYPSGDAP